MADSNRVTMNDMMQGEDSDAELKKPKKTKAKYSSKIEMELE